MKSWWKSKMVWLGILSTAVDVASAAQTLPVPIPPGVTTGVVTIGTIILRNLGKTSEPIKFLP